MSRVAHCPNCGAVLDEVIDEDDDYDDELSVDDDE